MSLEVVRADLHAAERWDQFALTHPEVRFCHLWKYRQVLERSYGYRCVYLEIRGGSDLVGIFPSIVARRGWRRLVSQPFNEYGGPLTHGLSTTQHSDVASLLLRAAHQEGCESVELRGAVGCDATPSDPAWRQLPPLDYATLPLGDPEHIWRKSLTHEARKGVRQGQKANLVAEVRRGSAAVADPFYRLYLGSMKHLGVPPHPRKFFAEFAAAFDDGLTALWVRQEGRPVAVLLGAVSGSRIHIFVTASDVRAWAVRPNDFAHWELIRWACAQGFRLFDFGSARYPGQIQFKKKWGVGFHTAGHYLIGGPHAAASPRDEALQSSSPTMAALAKLWRGVVPVWLTPLLGPPLRRYLTR